MFVERIGSFGKRGVFACDVEGNDKNSKRLLEIGQNLNKRGDILMLIGQCCSQTKLEGIDLKNNIKVLIPEGIDKRVISDIEDISERTDMFTKELNLDITMGRLTED
ncbi:MAG: hypothetical protein PHX34_02565 [Candidatus Shapirobacteria bacterium]|nr:hypothetical protein [Candidatus Shapirobacteria bacterium]